MTDLPKAELLPGTPFEAKARKKRSKSRDPVTATSCTPSFEDVRPFLSGKPLRGLTPSTPPAPQPPQAQCEPPPGPGTDRDENIAA